MAVSANTLFHFTDSISLQGILKTKYFWPQYSLEYFEGILPNNNPYEKAYIPLVCFCDLTITQLLGKHTLDFGRYGIGLKKDWGEENSVSPVVYVHKNSLPSQNINELIQYINELTEEGYGEDPFINKIRSKLLDSFKYIKPYKGFWQKGIPTKEEVIYYNEREWRFCPNKDSFTIFSGSKPSNHKKTENFNNKFKTNKSLSFSPSDIKYLVIDKNSDIDIFFKTIDEMKIEPHEKNRLKTKVITFEDIEADY